LAIDILYVGRIEYGHALDLQMDLWKKVSSGESRDTLILLEHPEVITLGVRGKKENILIPEDELIRLGVEVRQINRGGDVTYHGPGQIVGYPIMNLNNWGRDIRDYILKG
jgi:lipoyl(octanoyl) transferase